ncbi:SIS3 [Symbiodinium sp. CCMP2456]|nr:SIS3 [Symbiodinium sp. CCMP2456]
MSAESKRRRTGEICAWPQIQEAWEPEQRKGFPGDGLEPLVEVAPASFLGSSANIAERAVPKPKPLPMPLPPPPPLLPILPRPAYSRLHPGVAVATSEGLRLGLQHCAKASSKAAPTAAPTAAALRPSVRGRGQRFGSQSYLRSWDLNEPGQRLEPDPSPKLTRILQSLVPFELEAFSEEACAICYESMQGELVRRLPCMHVFHASCIARWLRVRMCCPLDKCEVEPSLQARPELPRGTAQSAEEEVPSSDSSPLYQPSPSSSPSNEDVEEAASTRAVTGKEPLLLVE